jgi:type IV pilus assembly protein PilX
MKIYREQIVNCVHLNARLNQNGMALIFVLVVLMILTILGVSALRMSSLEQIMSGNTQELMRAMEAADSGLGASLKNMPTDLTTFTDYTSYDYSAMKATITARTPKFIQITQAAPSSKPTDNSIGRAYYDQQVVGATALTNARIALHQGLNTGAPMNPYSP